MLPQTGEMLASLIVILIGFSLFIFSIGILAIRELYQKTSWEVN
jgi:LPXTG-motif cell wall-anchored protein